MPDRKFESRSEDVQEILSLIPHGIVRWGTTVIFLAIIMLIVVTWIIKYPEIITTRITLTTENPPVSVVAQSSGKLVRLFVRENDFVKADRVLAAIDNPARLEDVLELRRQLASFDALVAKPDAPVALAFNKNAKLGELQAEYSNFLQSYFDHQFVHQDHYYEDKIKSIEAQMAVYNDLNAKLARQNEILAQEVELAKKKHENNKILFAEKLVSEFDVTTTENAYLEKKYALENAKNSIINNNILLAEYQKTILDLNQQRNEKRRSLVIAVQENYKKLQSQLALWEQKYILKAPLDGHVSFFKVWSDNQFVRAGDEVMKIAPAAHGLLGKVYLPGSGSGMVKRGQKVRIKFDGYPFYEFGAVEGQIESISLVSRDNQYVIDVSLSKGLQTSYRRTLDFKQGMQGDVDIITEDLRLIERVFNRFRYVFTTFAGQ
jgi:multidrug resistance efflux pump